MTGAAPLPRLMLVTDRRATAGRDLVAVVREAMAGGVRFVQVREKDLPEAEARPILEAIVAAAAEGAVVAVNGRPALARALGVALHLPAGTTVGDRSGIALLGMAAHDEREAAAAREAGADYVIAGPVFPTASKPGHPGGGTALVRRIVSVVGRSVPVYAIGGVTAERVGEVLRAGAHGVSVRSAILGAVEVRAAASELTAALSAFGRAQER